MIDVCEKCSGKHIIHIDNMDICDDCMSTIVYDDDGNVLSTLTTKDDFVKYYNSVRAFVNAEGPIPDDVCKKLVSMALDIPTMLNMYGILLINKGDYDNAIKYLKRALKINPGYRSAYFNIAKAYYSIEDYPGMLQILECAKKYVSPDDIRYKDYLGEYACALAAIGRIRKAEMVLETAEKHGFEHGDSIKNMICGNNNTLQQNNAQKTETVSPEARQEILMKKAGGVKNQETSGIVRDCSNVRDDSMISDSVNNSNAVNEGNIQVKKREVGKKAKGFFSKMVNGVKCHIDYGKYADRRKDHFVWKQRELNSSEAFQVNMLEKDILVKEKMRWSYSTSSYQREQIDKEINAMRRAKSDIIDHAKVQVRVPREIDEDPISYEEYKALWEKGDVLI